MTNWGLMNSIELFLMKALAGGAVVLYGHVVTETCHRVSSFGLLVILYFR